MVHAPARSLFIASLIVGLSCLSTSGASAQRRGVSRDSSQEEPRAEKSKKAAPAHANPMGVFDEIENGWRAGNVDAILKHFGKQKVTISVGGTGPSGGEFSRNQSYYLLKDLFKFTVTRKFEVIQYRKPDDGGRTSFAVAERQYQRSDDGRLFKDKIYIALRLEGADGNQRWVVDEIKSIR